MKYPFLLEGKKRYIEEIQLYSKIPVLSEKPYAPWQARNGTQILKTGKHKRKYQVSLSNDKKEAG